MRGRPLSLIAIGVMVVALDFRVVAADVLPDVVGWLLVGAGAWMLGFVPSAGLALVAAVASAPDVLAPHHFEALDPITGEVVADPRPGTKYPERLTFDSLTHLRLALVVIVLVAGGAALWSVLGTLHYRARVTGDQESAGRLRLLRWLVPTVWVGPYLAAALVQLARGGGFDPVWNGGYELVALGGLCVAAATAWVLAVNSNRIWTATDAERLTPWGKMMIDGS